MLNAMQVANSYNRIDGTIAEIDMLCDRARCNKEENTTEINYVMLEIISQTLVGYKKLMEHILKKTEI